jgi:hypothetical protein
LVCHDLDLIDEKGLSLNNTWSNYAGVKMFEDNALDVIVKHNYSWIFSPTSGMSLPLGLARNIFPLPIHKWKISADEPMAFKAACLRSLGIISDRLGSYRLHSKNSFAAFHDDIAAKGIAGLTHTTRRYFFCKQIAADFNAELPSPKDNYYYYRRCCLIAREKPYRYILELLRRNIQDHLSTRDTNILRTIFEIVRYFTADMLIIAGRVLLRSSKHNLLKAKFDQESSSIDEDQLNYILHDV